LQDKHAPWTASAERSDDGAFENPAAVDFETACAHESGVALPSSLRYNAASRFPPQSKTRWVCQDCCWQDALIPRTTNQRQLYNGQFRRPHPNWSAIVPAKRQPGFLETVLNSALLVGVLFAVKGVEIVFRLPLEQFGIRPRTEWGLLGIVFCPLLHANLQHLIANSVPLFVMLVLLLGNPEYHPGRTLASIWLASGFGTWLIGRGGAVHIGASSVIFGLAAFLIVAGFHGKSWRSVFIAIFVFVFYGGIFYGALPHPGPISWEGHLCGAVAGIWLGKNWRP
jgi:membrane associated rhomboid family serine protease